MALDQSYMQKLSESLGMDLKLDEHGFLSLSYEERSLLLSFKESSQSFLVYIEIGALKGYNDEKVLKHLLMANFLYSETSGGSLSYDEIHNKIGLNYIINIYNQSPDDFVANLNAVVILADKLSAQLLQLQDEIEKDFIAFRDGLEQEEEPLNAMQYLQI
ncbi:MAG: type III secretion system chaperone [Succinatimonas sp.]|nr:type III secretion system chaperone [Succinatimonas sp.]